MNKREAEKIARSEFGLNAFCIKITDYYKIGSARDRNAVCILRQDWGSSEHENFETVISVCAERIGQGSTWEVALKRAKQKTLKKENDDGQHLS